MAFAPLVCLSFVLARTKKKTFLYMSCNCTQNKSWAHVRSLLSFLFTLGEHTQFLYFDSMDKDGKDCYLMFRISG